MKPEFSRHIFDNTQI